MSNISIYNNGTYNELCDLVRELTQWFDYDKIKWYGVYMWSKDDPSDEQHPYGENVFDIYANEIQFYPCEKPWGLTTEALLIINKIQDKLKELEEFMTNKSKELGVYA